MLVDSAEIHVCGGRGGDGSVSFRREKYVPHGGPDGGDGGHGGSVFIRANQNVETLLDCSGKYHWHAENGRPGSGRNKTGRGGQDLYLDLPPGTLVYDKDTEILLVDLKPRMTVCVAQRGKGGRGNKRFATATNRVPAEAESGEPGESRTLRLELKLIADIGIVGLPNAGKSTLLSRLSHARPKIADYPFTTLTPQLGVLELSDGRRLILADIPGLIEGAHEGAGLGDAFLKHIERTRALLHLVDCSPLVGVVEPAEAYRTIRAELAAYSEVLASKPEVLAASKLDVPGSKERAEALGAATGREALCISAATGAGLRELGERLWRLGGELELDKEVEAPAELPMPTPPHRVVHDSPS